jgi:divalent metal cation (Fe/Co/Zn/Cd) transporter
MNNEEIKLKVMAYLDNELPESEMQEIRQLIEKEDSYRAIYQSLKNVKEVTQEMKLKKLPEMYWDEYWQHVYNRIERGISWILISIGVIIVGAYLIWQFTESLIANQNIPMVLKTGILILIAGLVVLIVSILREKLMVRKVDKYREVER